jgi:hypothetical protein
MPFGKHSFVFQETFEQRLVIDKMQIGDVDQGLR